MAVARVWADDHEGGVFTTLQWASIQVQPELRAQEQFGDGQPEARRDDRDHDQQDDDPRGHDDPAIATGPAFPHCRQPVAIVAWLVRPAAATVAAPPRHASETRDEE